MASVKWALTGRQICSEGKRVHLYGGVAAICSDMIPLQEEKRCLVQELFVVFFFSLAFAFALSCLFSKTFDGSFLGTLVGAFL